LGGFSFSSSIPLYSDLLKSLFKSSTLGSHNLSLIYFDCKYLLILDEKRI
jgi:hypothetical protein